MSRLLSMFSSAEAAAGSPAPLAVRRRTTTAACRSSTAYRRSPTPLQTKAYGVRAQSQTRYSSVQQPAGDEKKAVVLHDHRGLTSCLLCAGRSVSAVLLAGMVSTGCPAAAMAANASSIATPSAAAESSAVEAAEGQMSAEAIAHGSFDSKTRERLRTDMIEQPGPAPPIDRTATASGYAARFPSQEVRGGFFTFVSCEEGLAPVVPADRYCLHDRPLISCYQEPAVAQPIGERVMATLIAFSIFAAPAVLAAGILVVAVALKLGVAK